MFSVFRQFRALVEAIHALATVLQEVAAAQREAGPAADRLNALELSRHQFEAQVESTLLKADGKLKAASNAEARERQLKKSYERLVDELDPDSEAPAPDAGRGVLPYDAQAGEAQGVPAVRLALAPSGKTLAVRAKFGLT